MAIKPYRSIASIIPDYAANFNKKDVLNNDVQNSSLQADQKSNAETNGQTSLLVTKQDKDEAVKSQPTVEQAPPVASEPPEPQPTIPVVAPKPVEQKQEIQNKPVDIVPPPPVASEPPVTQSTTPVVNQAPVEQTQQPTLQQLAQKPAESFQGGKSEKTVAIQKILGLNPTGVWDNTTNQAYLNAMGGTGNQFSSSSNSSSSNAVVPLNGTKTLSKALTDTEHTTETKTPQITTETYQNFKPVGFDPQIQALNDMRARIAAELEKKHQNDAEYQKLKKQYDNIAGLTDIGNALTNLYYTSGGTLKNPGGLTENAPVINGSHWSDDSANYRAYLQKLQQAGDNMAAKRLADLDKKEADLRKDYFDKYNNYLKTGTIVSGGDETKDVTKQSQTAQKELEVKDAISKRENATERAKIAAGKTTVHYITSRGVDVPVEFNNGNEAKLFNGQVYTRLMGTPLAGQITDFVKKTYAPQILDLKKAGLTDVQAVQQLVKSDATVEQRAVGQFWEQPIVRNVIEKLGGKKVSHADYVMPTTETSKTGTDEYGNPVVQTKDGGWSKVKTIDGFTSGASNRKIVPGF